MRVQAEVTRSGRGGFGLCVKYLRGVTHAACCQGIDCAGGSAQTGTDGWQHRLMGVTQSPDASVDWELALRHTHSHAAWQCQVTRRPPSYCGGHADGSPTMYIVRSHRRGGTLDAWWLSMAAQEQLGSNNQHLSHSMTKGSSGDSANGRSSPRREFVSGLCVQNTLLLGVFCTVCTK